MSFDNIFKKPTTSLNEFVSAWSERREGGGLEYKGWRFLVTSDNGQYVLSAKPMRETKSDEDSIPEQVAALLGAPPNGRRGYYWFWRPN